MIIIKTKNYKELSKIANSVVIDEIKKKPNLSICLATGETPIGLYKELIKANKKKLVNLSKITGFILDEYYPIQKNNKNSYYYFMNKNLFNHINIKKKNIYFLNPETKNPTLECTNYEKEIRKRKLDLVILGIGINSHIAFNEPGLSFTSKTRLVNLTNSTIKRNSRLFKNIKNVPKKGLTVGLSTIMSAKKIILLASSKKKRNAIKRLIKGKINPKYPANILKRHKNLIIIVDKEAIGKI